MLLLKKIPSSRYQLLVYLALLCTPSFSIGSGSVYAHRDEGHLQSMYKKHLLISSTRSPLVKKPELAVVSSGKMEKIILDILADHLGFTYEIVPPRDILSTGFLQRNGSWTGTTGQLQRKEVDMCVTWSAAALSKAKILDNSYPVVYADSAIIIPFPKENSRVWFGTSSFQYWAWIAILITFIATILISWIIFRIDSSRVEVKAPNLTGLIQYAERTAKSQNRCRVSEMVNAQAHKITPLGRTEMSGSFVILALGMAISFCVFLVELIITKMKKASARK
ncbi:hypothetical protein GHT06_015611 [Daphnia sinensis]|uniref:Ionotropic glutamate receptor L-glutamate and glycine-binding domain-containing protein n=1 Tax=Daphnia sinensis TaxID=1820382 RepID=A0AAD5KRG0_9CRUS|nr:hypothetical protein GHT06_015611 [Daphnia sinensis]